MRRQPAVRLMIAACVVAGGVAGRAPDDPAMELVGVRKIWDQAPHNAFTDLIRFKGKWYCAFREGKGHVSDDGQLRVLRSDDGESWASVARLAWDGGDARDAKLSITSGGELLLNGAVRFLEPVDGNRHQSVTWLSADGENWSGPLACPSGLGTWRWSVTWHDGMAYSFGYSGKDAAGCLYRSADGRTWEVVKSGVFPDADSYGNETSLLFTDAGAAWCLLRRDKGSQTALLGVSQPPYTKWTWTDLGVRVGGPKMIQDRDGGFLAVVRLYDGGARTSLCRIDPAAGHFTEVMALPSGGDTSYAGMVISEGLLWISYYSSHEDRASIYLAKVEINTL